MVPFFSFSILTFSAFCSSCYCFNCDFKLLQFVICIISNVLFLFSDFQSKNNLVSAAPLGTGPDIYLTQVQTGLLGELGEPTNHLCLPIFSNACCLHVFLANICSTLFSFTTKVVTGNSAASDRVIPGVPQARIGSSSHAVPNNQIEIKEEVLFHFEHPSSLLTRVVIFLVVRVDLAD